MKGKLIVLEGTDASGKGTQTRLLVENLKKRGLDVREKDFPQYYTSFYGGIIGKFLKGEFGDPTKVDPYLSSLLYAGDRFEAKADLIKWKDEGKIIVLNRYVPSNLAFNMAKIDRKDKKAEFARWLEDLEYGTNSLPKPDLVLFLNVPYDIAKEWILRKDRRDYIEGQKKDGYEKDKDFLERVYDEYVSLCGSRPDWKDIDCVKDGKARTIEEISKDILSEVAKLEDVRV